MDPFWKDIVDVVAKGFTAASAVVAAVSLYRSRQIRDEDLLWRKASAAREALTDIHKNPYAVEAVHIVDCVNWSEPYSAPPSLSELKAISPETLNTIFLKDDKARADAIPPQFTAYIRRCFDWLLYYIDRVEYQSGKGIVHGDDFAEPLVPYAKFMADRWQSYFGELARRENYINAPGLIARLSGTDLHRMTSPRHESKA